MRSREALVFPILSVTTVAAVLFNAFDLDGGTSLVRTHTDCAACVLMCHVRDIAGGTISEE